MASCKVMWALPCIKLAWGPPLYVYQLAAVALLAQVFAHALVHVDVTVSCFGAGDLEGRQLAETREGSQAVASM